MSARPIRVLVVDDSAFARKVVRQILTAAPGIEVVDIARDGLEALEKIAQHKPDVVTLDLVMPNLDGLGVLRAQGASGPRFVVVSISGGDSALGLEALELGAVDVVQKPTALASDRLYEIGRDLVTKVLGAATAQMVRASALAPVAPARQRTSGVEVVLIGASTGGPPAVGRLLAALPPDFPVPLVVVVHLPAEYTEAFARRLDNPAGLRVREATDGLPIAPGQVVIARGGIHLELARSGAALTTRLSMAPYDTLHRPSVDVLFESAARAAGERALGVVLTGMGDDGVAGARALKQAGAMVITEAESSCVVYGMPRAVVAAGASDAEVPLERMAVEIVRRAV